MSSLSCCLQCLYKWLIKGPLEKTVKGSPHEMVWAIVLNKMRPSTYIDPDACIKLLYWEQGFEHQWHIDPLLDMVFHLNIHARVKNTGAWGEYLHYEWASSDKHAVAFVSKLNFSRVFLLVQDASGDTLPQEAQVSTGHLQDVCSAMCRGSCQPSLSTHNHPTQGFLPLQNIHTRLITTHVTWLTVIN